ncbi:MAG: hypothetical protein ACAH95_07850, partial [Fimbriimonas sp.]
GKDRYDLIALMNRDVTMPEGLFWLLVVLSIVGTSRLLGIDLFAIAALLIWMGIVTRYSQEKLAAEVKPAENLEAL